MEVHSQGEDRKPGETYKLEVENVVLEVPNEDLSSGSKYVRLLNGVSATFESGKLSVVMGPSGGSKTTLMNLIVGIVQKHSMSYGKILFQGEERDQNTWLSRIAYLNQDDCIVPYTTVYEYIYFCVNCRTAKKRRGSVGEIVSSVMKKLHIQDLKDTMMTAISGGERKRVMIAVEFAASPDVLILDEPTSGLDSHLAFELIQMVKQYAIENNSIVITTIHQPGPGLFNMFDDLLFLYRGSVVYSGPADKCEEFFDSKGVHRIGQLSISEFIFELFSDKSYVPGIEEYKETINEIIESVAQEGNSKTKDRVMKHDGNSPINLPFSLSKALMIAKRQFIIEWRSWRMLKNRILEMVFLGFYIYFMYPINFVGKFINYTTDLHLDTSAESGSKFIFCQLLRFLKSNFDESLGPNIDEGIKWEMSPFLLFLLSSLGQTELLDGLDYIHREISKGTYGPSTLYFSTWITETLPIILKYLMFVGIISSLGVHDGNTIELITYIIIGNLLVLSFNIMTRSIASSNVLKRLLSMFTVIFIPLLNPDTLYVISGFLSSPSVGTLGLLRFFKYFLLPFWPHIFFQGFMKLSFFERVLFPVEPNEKFTPPYKTIMGILVNSWLYDPRLSDEENKEKLFNPQTKFLVNYDYSRYFLLLCGAISLMIVVLVSNFALMHRFSPRLRLRLSKR
ncbi:White ABC transporter [Encephalitozoon romaleae SJ-2008]|uniref:White ABC transporter n=1 Tax=Encephalitozoon romaleae (strain SJ-2008) TaxID=1178016 RepID=I7ATZ7_ENCRO|nr:White ABC transporter [Encephalitozoon romaleae SJ-2008]AFN83957.1 White ABC transporter [Encephalitozoon romaleae SJ-2008]